MGHGETTRVKKPQELSHLKGTGPLLLVVGENHSCVIADRGRDVYFWGLGDKGQLGRGGADMEAQSVPRLTPYLRDKQISLVSCGADHTLALSKEGILFGFGGNAYGQVGVGASAKLVVNPEIVPGPWQQSSVASDPHLNAPLSSVKAGPFASAAISRSGQLFVWGCGANKILCNGSENNEYSPKQIRFETPFDKSYISDVAFGSSHCLALTSNIHRNEKKK